MGSSEMDAIPETGAVFTIGRSRFADNIASHFFIRKDPVVSIACGDEHSAVICQSGRLFVFGSNDWGQLGLGHKNHISKPSCVKVLKPEKVTHVACGRAHTLICTGAQKIFACGSDQEGQLGRGSSKIGDSASSPVLVYDCGLAGPRILQIAAGSHHSLALTSDGGVVAWGSNLEGQLGLSGTSGLVNKPTKVHIPEPVKEISAGYYHSAFLTESGSVYVCGESESGKLGIDVNFSTQVAPKQMQLPSPAARVTCGGHHTLVLAENGNLYCAGSNASGQLGMGTNVSEVQTPKLLPQGALQNEAISRIACGESHTAVVTETGKLFTCGDGRHGKLGLEENENNVHELTFAPKYQELFVTNVACGGCHTILIARTRNSNGQANHEADPIQIDHLNKKNPLPPLKLPVNRLQSEPIEKIKEENAKLEESKKSEPASGNTGSDTEETTVQTTSELLKSPEKDISESTVKERVQCSVDKTNGITEENKSPKNSEKVSKDVSKQTSPMPEDSRETKEVKEAENSKESEPPNTKPTQDVEEPIETDKTQDVEDVKNVETTAKTETPLINETNEKKDSEETETKQKEKDVKEENSRNVENKEEEQREEEEVKASEQPKPSPEKPISSGGLTPPPKPPRLKPGSAGSSSQESKSAAETEKQSLTESEVKQEKKSTASNLRVTEINMTNDRIEIISIGKEEEEEKEEPDNNKESEEMEKRKASLKKEDAEDERQNSEKANDDNETPDTIKVNSVEEKNEKNKSTEEEKPENEATEDDADVIQSPVAKPSKIKKLFKPKRQDDVEKNGTKVIGASNHKPKSKTCSLL